jgi:hypothetical protein
MSSLNLGERTQDERMAAGNAVASNWPWSDRAAVRISAWATSPLCESMSGPIAISVVDYGRAHVLGELNEHSGVGVGSRCRGDRRGRVGDRHGRQRASGSRSRRKAV